MPRAEAVRPTRRAISPRLAMRTEVMGVLVEEEERWRLLWEERIARANARDLDAGIIESATS
jgi:hypothetical protein